MLRVWESSQRLLAIVGLLATSPLLVALAIAVRATSAGPALHRATRNSGGRPFTILKFRTMTTGSSGLGITAAGDPRITRIGRWLRDTKLDELPQLWNVVRGEMLLVGPRPEDPRYIDWTDPLHESVFRSRPGMTGPAALQYRDEEELLARLAHRRARAVGRPSATADDIDEAYRLDVLPGKLAIDAAYLRGRSIRGDLLLLIRTVRPARA